jgi:hypothetical protein
MKILALIGDIILVIIGAILFLVIITTWAAIQMVKENIPPPKRDNEERSGQEKDSIP